MHKNPKAAQPSKVLCSINGKPAITSEQLDAEVKNMLKDSPFNQEEMGSQEAVRSMVYEMLVNQAVAQEWAKQAKIEEQPSYKKELETLKAGLVYELFEREALGSCSISDTDAEAFYNDHEEMQEEFADEKTKKPRTFAQLSHEEQDMVKEMLKDEQLQDAIDELKETFNVEEQC